MNETSPSAQPPAGQAISERLASYAAGFSHERIPAPVRERAKFLMLDAFGIAFASHGYEFAERALAGIDALNDGGSACVIGSPLRMQPRDAILANGILIHGLDFDDTHPRGVIHATTSVLPTVLAVAARHDRSGADLLAAYVLGVEIATRLGAVAKGGFHQVGFHPTGLIGAFGCTVAAGWLMGLTEAQQVHAQGLVMSMASGSLEFLNDGAWNKRMHPGWAGVAAVTAAALAKHGYVGTRLAYEGRFGLYNSHLGAVGGFDLDLATAGLGERWEVPQVSVKPLPACHFTHAAVDAAIRLHQQGVRVEEIARVEVLVPKETIKTVCEPEAQKRRPANSYEAQFSIPYLVANALRKGRLALEDIEADALADERTLALAARTDYRADPDSSFPKYYDGEVIVRLQDGRTLRAREPINRGSPDRPLTAEDITAKFRANAARHLDISRLPGIERAVLAVEAASATALADILGEPAQT
jgi:2-methylcitrate dehydratase PrpD